jgi:predicted dehydrogenase
MAGTAALIQPGRASAVVGANEKVRLALIGAGSRGNQLLDAYLRRDEVDVISVADIDDHHAGQTAERIKKAKGNTPKTTRDYRELLDDKDLDAVIIATTDHWHAAPTIHACQAGKDVYCEKPLAHNVREGQAMIEASKKYKRVVAVGTQQRSSENFRKAVETVKSGKIGEVFWIQTWNFENISPDGMGKPADTQPPSHVDYDRWLGPAPKVAFNPSRFHLLFRWYFDYAGGMMSDWGVHLNDIALWALDSKGPKSVSCTGGIFTTDDLRDTPDTMQVVYEFPKCTLTYSMRKGNGYKFNGKSYGIMFCGTDGTLMLDRSGHEIIPDHIDEPYGIRFALGNQAPKRRTITLASSSFKAKDDGLPDHVANFLECLKTRERPTTSVEINHPSTNTCHLGNIAYRLGRKLFWDADREEFKNDAEANALLGREYRKGYELPKV